MKRVKLLGLVITLIFCARMRILVAQDLSSSEAIPAPLEESEAALSSDDDQDILSMDLEQLAQADVVVPAMDTVVSSVARQESTVGRSAAAVFVITPEMIDRSAARNVPDLLRMVPGIEVARIDSNKWAITSRGFNSQFSNKLLVLIDGRTIYQQAFAGVYWDMHQPVLEDIARIEVIRGPGATVWGANAVNGVINIITKGAGETQGGLAVGGTGTEEHGFSTLRYGGKAGQNLSWRIHGQQFERDGGFHPDISYDDWRQAQAGFRTDWTPTDSDTFTVLGNAFDGQAGAATAFISPTPPFPPSLEFHDVNVRGQNILMRWTRVLDEDSDWSLQAYYDNAERSDPFIDYGEKTFDLDFQYRLPWRNRHNIICGAGYRHINDRFLFSSLGNQAVPPFRNTNLFSYFVQDEITIQEDRLYLTAGSKFQHNDFSGFEYQPSVRLLYLPSERESVWAAVSRAVRTPSRVEHDATFTLPFTPYDPLLFQVAGNEAVEAEDLLAFELGYRSQPNDDFSWDLAAFYNDYRDLITTNPAGAPFVDPSLGGVVVPLVFTNSSSADTYGIELASTYRINPSWELIGSYSLLYMDVHAPSTDLVQGSSPHNQCYLRSSWDLGSEFEFDVIGRYVDNLPALGIPSYLTMDVRFAWRPRKHLEWAVVGRNLLDDRHPEFAYPFSIQSLSTEVQSEMFTTLTWEY